MINPKVWRSGTSFSFRMDFLFVGRCCPVIRVAVYTIVPGVRQARRLGAIAAFIFQCMFIVASKKLLDCI